MFHGIGTLGCVSRAERLPPPPLEGADAEGLVAPDAGAVVRGLLGDAEMGADVGPGGAGAVRARHRLLLRHAALHRLGHLGDQLALARLARRGARAVLLGDLEAAVPDL